jgi:hypothetical protein
MLPGLAAIDLDLDSRAATFENPTGARGAGGTAAGGRKGAPSRIVRAGERVVLADLDGPGVIRHIWCTVPPAPPATMRALVLEVFYDGRDEPSVSVPLLDFFGCAQGRPTAYTSALTAAQEGRGFNAYFPMPFGDHVRVELVNGAARATIVYYQIDYTLVGALGPDDGLLHVSFRRENPTELRRDFTICAGLSGPGRFLGCVVGVRPIDRGSWYGEGEVKIYRDGDTELPTICGTGLEDYVGSAWGMGAHHALWGGAPLDLRPGDRDADAIPDHVGFYRWHGPDPIVFRDELRVTIQQIGMHQFAADAVEARDAYVATNPLAGHGWFPIEGAHMGLFERRDDVSAAAFVYCRSPQAVPSVNVAAATADLDRFAYETPSRFEALWP